MTQLPAYPKVPSSPWAGISDHTVPALLPISFLCPTGAAPSFFLFGPETQESSCHVSSTLLFNPHCILLALPSKGTLRPHLPSPLHTECSRPCSRTMTTLFYSPNPPPNAPQSPTQSVTTPPCLPLLFLCHSALAIAIAQTHLAPAGGLCPLCFLCMGFFLQTPPPPPPPGFGHLITWLRSPLFKLAAPPVPPHPLPTSPFSGALTTL